MQFSIVLCFQVIQEITVQPTSMNVLKGTLVSMATVQTTPVATSVPVNQVTPEKTVIRYIMLSKILTLFSLSSG